MSEIKGQLLGIIIVLMVFAAVGTAMVGVFTKVTKTVEDTVTNTISDNVKSHAINFMKY